MEPSPIHIRCRLIRRENEPSSGPPEVCPRDRRPAAFIRGAGPLFGATNKNGTKLYLTPPQSGTHPHPTIQENSVAQIDATAAGSDSFVPVIDMAPYLAGTPEGKRRVAEQLGRACREIGFYVIVGHGVAPEMVEQVEAV